MDLNCIKIENNKNILGTLFEKIEQKANIENVIDWFQDEATINYISGILAEDFGITDVNKAIEDIEKIYLKEKKIARRNDIIVLLNNRQNLKEEDISKLELELNNIIIELAKMK